MHVIKPYMSAYQTYILHVKILTIIKNVWGQVGLPPIF